MRKAVAILLCCLCLGGCGVAQEEFDKVKNENVTLQNENDALKGENSSLAADKQRLEAELQGFSKAEEQKQAAEESEALSKEEAKENQLVTVQGANIVVQSSSDRKLYPDMMLAELKNVSEDTVKSYTVGFLAYDENGLPLAIKGSYDISGEAYEKLAQEQGVNILAGGTHKNKTGWGVTEDHGITYLIACVKEVDFLEQGQWKNPYYAYWLEEYAEKQMDVEVLKNMY